ncbi:MAG: peptidylprolyl isomerase [Planctomycetes bacterium]|nr:peptidylprolyl isomerase [Planctomycetota bacterium]
MQNGVTNAQPPAAAPPAVTTTAPTATGKTSWVAKLQNPWVLHKLLMLAIIVGVGVGAFCWGRKLQQATANSQEEIDRNISQRAVAYLYGDKIVTRQEFGEYLIDRCGADRLDYMLNRKIVEIECAKHGITATNAEVEERFQHDLKMINPYMTEKDFVSTILHRFGKTLLEWKEDVIRPKLMMEKYVKATVKITDVDLQEGYEARYGPRVDCRMIVCEKDKAAIAQKIWEYAKKNRDSFLEEARKQYIPNLAQNEGRVPPIHKNFGDKDLENMAFALQEGEVSRLLKMSDGTFVILLCEKKLPANVTIRFDDVRTSLAKEMYDLRVAQKIPDAFTEMRNRAKPNKVLDNTGSPSTSMVSADGPPLSSPGPIILPKSDVKIPAPPVPGAVTPPSGEATPLPPALPPTGVILPKAIAPPAPIVPPMPPMPMLTPEKKQ